VDDTYKRWDKWDPDGPDQRSVLRLFHPLRMCRAISRMVFTLMLVSLAVGAPTAA
jgi:hypothetical protein